MPRMTVLAKPACSTCFIHAPRVLLFTGMPGFQPHPTLAEDGSEAARTRLFYADANGTLGSSTGARMLGELAAQVRGNVIFRQQR